MLTNLDKSPPDAGIRIKLTQTTNGVILSVAGALDLSTRDQFSDRLNTVIKGTEGNIVVDLSSVEFFALAGVRVLLDAQSQLEPATRLRLVTSSLTPLRVLQLTGLATRFHIFASTTAALDDVSSPETQFSDDDFDDQRAWA